MLSMDFCISLMALSASFVEEPKNFSFFTLFGFLPSNSSSKIMICISSLMMPSEDVVGCADANCSQVLGLKSGNPSAREWNAVATVC